jgi:exodeoxyribonuclease VII large subunit
MAQRLAAWACSMPCTMPESPAATATNAPVLSVAEIAGAVKKALESAFARIRVRGEISRPNYHASGHLYFTLKDDQAVIDAVCWRGRVGALKLRAEPGLEVIVTGRVSSYPGSSKYQIVVEEMELAGEGAILKLLEERRKQLLAEGLFAPERKKPIPYLPGVIGVITSPTGAVIRDIIHRLADRFPRHVLLWPVRVQGEGAAAEVAAAIEGFNRLQPGGAVPRPDLIIVARGGGSLEDLWAFNEEVVVRAAAASAIPLISAVGHETDTTLIDFAADRRAPTPTAAAEMAVPVRSELVALTAQLGARLAAGIDRGLKERGGEVGGLARGLPEPRRLLEQAWQTLDERATRLAHALGAWLARRAGELAELGARLPHPRQALALNAERLELLAGRLESAAPRAMQRAYERAAEPWHRLDAGRRMAEALKRLLAERALALEAQGRLLDSVSHAKVLERGFAFVEAEGQLATRAAQVAPGAALVLHFHDGRVQATAEGAARPRPARPRDPGPQGSLL